MKDYSGAPFEMLVVLASSKDHDEECNKEVQRELGRRVAEAVVKYVRNSEPLISSADVIPYIRALLTEDASRESLCVLALDAKNRLIDSKVIFKGTATKMLLSPREIFRFALEVGAFRIIMGHNHPSGDPTPSKEDEEFTKIVASAGEMIGILLLDHLIIGVGHVSLRDAGMIQ